LFGGFEYDQSQSWQIMANPLLILDQRCLQNICNAITDM
jgi:hypothetical protein